jgi:putative ABC transport system ATP-binding protein
VIRTHGLAHRHPGGPPLAFPDVDLPQGGTLLLRGASGAGKSTWIAIACGLLAPDAGRIEVAGQDLARLSRTARDAWRGRTIGLLPQKLHLSEALTVERNLALAYYATGQREDSASISRTLAALGVADCARRRPAQLSGGQAQRVALARAVLLAPRVLVADEPTASLDDAAAQAALHLLRQSAGAAGATLVVSTHDHRVAQALPGAQVLQLALPQAVSA